MGVLVTENFLSENEVESTRLWLDSKKELWLDNAFSATFIKEDVPNIFKKFITDKHNLYHFIFLITESHNEIKEHVDGDFRDIINEELPGNIINFPETVVYYYQIDENMEGGKLCIENSKITPRKNMAVVIPQNIPHSVSEITNASIPRFSIVCERYYILNRLRTKLNSPMFREG